MGEKKKYWDIWIDTGGTFTDCIAIDLEGRYRKQKVLSNSALRGKVKSFNPPVLKIDQNWNAPDGFLNNSSLKLLDINHDVIKIQEFKAGSSEIILENSEKVPVKDLEEVPFEIRFEIEAPVLACYLVTGKCLNEKLPEIRLRLATTKGTNTLLEKKGADTTLLITSGFGDLLKIGDQRRDDLFALKVEKPKAIYNRVLEIDERVDAVGNILAPLDFNFLDKMNPTDEGIAPESVAVCLMNSYKNSEHERLIKQKLEEKGYRYISISSEINSFIKILTRTQTTVVNAYLDPILSDYLNAVKDIVKSDSLYILTSAGGLETAGNFKPKDSLLSGPAGGVVGAASIGVNAGFQRIISFDMGGTSTDVSRYSGKFDYTFEHTVGSATLSAPALSIETVAAGGGSVCKYDGFKLKVGPESAGAYPGPACYGAGGPLTLTDVNLLLGRLEPDHFRIPIDFDAAQKQFEKIVNKVKSNDKKIDRHSLLEGFLTIANERMADAIRNISLRKGYDASDYALVTFGGAGAQHACAIADQLNIKDILIPENAGLLSAYGLGHASVEQFAEKQYLKPLEHVEFDIEQEVKSLEKEAREKLKKMGVETTSINIKRRILSMRLKGQESTLDIEYNRGKNAAILFRKAYEERYGHWVEDRITELESIRVVASSFDEPPKKEFPGADSVETDFIKTKEIIYNKSCIETGVYRREDCKSGSTIPGPALILDPYSTVFIEPGWTAKMDSNRTLMLSKKSDEDTDKRKHELNSETVSLELFTNRFTSIARDMGEMLRRTAISVNVKERRDFSCALLSRNGDLIVNAPHIPVHLGALGECVRKVKDTIDVKAGDVIVTNHPAFGGSHLPDITVITPIYVDEDQLMGFAASRAHHAEIGGTRPGSMPPQATSLVEEGVVISPTHIIKNGNEKWDDIRSILKSAPYPSRNTEENIADLQAAVAANQKGVRAFLNLIDKYGSNEIIYYMNALRKHAADKMRKTIKNLGDGEYKASELLDDGSKLVVKLSIEKTGITFDFIGTSAEHPRNLNATPAIVKSVIIYVMRLLVNEPLPLNEGLLEPVNIILPRCMLNPDFPEDPAKCPAVVGGNVETSQRLVDTLLKPFGVIACSQGTMNNILFGNKSFGYYETVGGGTGAGPEFHGTDAVHHHMTNTAATDPEILEHRYPVRLDRYQIRYESGGMGRYKGGNGIIREMTFLEPVELSVLTQHRKQKPYGLSGGKKGSPGRQWIERRDGDKEHMGEIEGKSLEKGDRFILFTPGGGGFGEIRSE